MSLLTTYQDITLLHLITFIKREGGNNKITSQLVFDAVIYPPLLLKRGNTMFYKEFLLASKYLYQRKSRYLIISKFTTLPVCNKYQAITSI